MIERAAYPLKEAAALLGGLSRGTLYNLEARGELRIIRLGRRALVSADEIRRLTTGDRRMTLTKGNGPAHHEAASETFDQTERRGQD